MGNKKLPLIIAVDFDDTIVNTDPFFNISTLKEGAKEVINKWYAQGIYIIIWTCRHMETKNTAELFLIENGINFHKINEHSIFTHIDWPNPGPKVYADIYIDDKSLELVSQGKSIDWNIIDEQVKNYIKLKNNV